MLMDTIQAVQEHCYRPVSVKPDNKGLIYVTEVPRECLI